MRYLGDLTLPLPSLPNGTTLDDAAKQQLIAQIRALPLNQQLIFVDVADATDEGSSRRFKRIGVSFGVGLAAGALSLYLLRRRAGKSRK